MTNKAASGSMNHHPAIIGGNSRDGQPDANHGATGQQTASPGLRGKHCVAQKRRCQLKMRNVVMAVLIVTVLLGATACGSGDNNARSANHELPVWCTELVDGLPFSREDLGACYSLSGVVVGVESSAGDGSLSYVEVAAGESQLAKVAMLPACSTWEVGDAFDEEVEIVARFSWPVDFSLPYCAAKPVPSRDSVPEQVSYEWCTDEGEPLPIPAVRDLIEDPEAEFPEPSERYLHKCFRIVGQVVRSDYPGYDTTEYVSVKLDESGSTVMVSGPSVCLSLKDEDRVDVLAFYEIMRPGDQNQGLGLPDFDVPDARHC